MSDFDFIEHLRKEEEHFLPEPPDGLWDGIVGNLPPKRRRRTVPLWLRYCGAAACITLTFGAGALLFKSLNNNDQLPKIAKKNVENSTGTPKPQPHPTNILADRKAACLAAVRKYPSQTVTREDTATHQDASTVSEPAILSTGNGEKENGSGGKKNENGGKRNDHRERSNNSTRLFAAHTTAKPRSAMSPSVSLYAGNIMAGSTSSRGNFMVLDPGLADTSVGSGPYDDILNLNQGVDVGTKKHYHLPVRAGIRVSFPLTDALTAESGLTYTLLSSSTESGSNENYYHTKQTLHYVGIPLKLRYKLWSGKRVGIYVSGGGMVEKCVSGKANTKFIIGGRKNVEDEQKISEKPLQFSTTLSAGIEANITKSTSLFIEPGASYYIDNHSSVDNVYKNKPFNVDLNIGLRININK